MARRSDHSKDQIREMALCAAEQIVSTEGLTGLSARKIAKAIGYTVGTLYIIYKNQDDLILHVNARTLDLLYQQMHQATVKCRQPRTCILAIGRAYVNFALKNPQRWNMIFEHRLPEGERVPAWYRSKVVTMFELIEEQLQPILVQHSKRKLKHVSRTLWCSVHGICALAVTDKLDFDDSESVQTLTVTLINYFLVGLSQELNLDEL